MAVKNTDIMCFFLSFPNLSKKSKELERGNSNKGKAKNKNAGNSINIPGKYFFQEWNRVFNVIVCTAFTAFSIQKYINTSSYLFKGCGKEGTFSKHTLEAHNIKKQYTNSEKEWEKSIYIHAGRRIEALMPVLKSRKLCLRQFGKGKPVNKTVDLVPLKTRDTKRVTDAITLRLVVQKPISTNPG